jgi:hypothetical protein
MLLFVISLFRIFFNIWSRKHSIIVMHSHFLAFGTSGIRQTNSTWCGSYIGVSYVRLISSPVGQRPIGPLISRLIGGTRLYMVGRPLSHCTINIVGGRKLASWDPPSSRTPHRDTQTLASDGKHPLPVSRWHYINRHCPRTDLTHTASPYTSTDLY